MLKRIHLSACFAALLFHFPASAQSPADAPPSVDELVRKNIEAHGGLEKIKAIQTLKITGQASVQGMDEPITVQLKRPNSLRVDAGAPGQSFIQAYDGSTAWVINPFMGGPDPQQMPDKEAKQLQEDADLDGAFVDYKAKGSTIEYAGKEDVQGAPAYKLKVTRKSGSVQYVYLDVNTYLESKQTGHRTQMGQEVDVETYLSGYKSVNGTLMPFTTEQKVNGNTVMRMVAEKIEPNVPIDDAVFKMPVKPEPPAK